MSRIGPTTGHPCPSTSLRASFPPTRPRCRQLTSRARWRGGSAGRGRAGPGAPGAAPRRRRDTSLREASHRHRRQGADMARRRWPTSPGSSRSAPGTIARDLRAALAKNPSRVMVIGRGLIGCEAASCCRDLGLAVTLVDPNPTPARPPARNRDRGYAGRTDARRRGRFPPEDDGPRALGRGRAGPPRAPRRGERRLRDGSRHRRPRATRDTGWLAAAGLAADAGGLTCDGACCRAISIAGARPRHLRGRRRRALAEPALRRPSDDGGALGQRGGDQARHAAANMMASASDQQPLTASAVLWSSQFGLNIKLAGHTGGAD